jgi:hypothetical protein
MTMPNRIQITHQPRTMSTLTIRAALDTFQQAANRGTAVYLSPELVQELRAALKAEPEGEGQEPSVADVDELCAEFGFHYADLDSLEMLRDMIAAALARWVHASAAAPEPRENPATPSAPEPATSGPVQPEIEVCETCDGEGTINELLVGGATANPAATCPDCDGVGETRRFHRQPQAAPVALAAAPAGGLVESIARIIASDSSEGPESFQGISEDVICEIGAWLYARTAHGLALALLLEEIDR